MPWERSLGRTCGLTLQGTLQRRDGGRGGYREDKDVFLEDKSRGRGNLVRALEID